MNDPTVDPDRLSWVAVPPGSDFPIQNLPFGVVAAEGSERHAVVAIGEQTLDLAVLHDAGMFVGIGVPDGVFSAGSLNPYLALGNPVWRATRHRIGELLDAAHSELRDSPLVSRALRPQDEATQVLPMEVGDYVDFYSSEQHATNVGEMFRPGGDPLLPNWKHLPVAYHGRSSTVVVSTTDIRRPTGQRRPTDGGRPPFGPSASLDIELEVGFVTGPGNLLGEPVPIANAEDHIFGLCLVNDWSARDLQAWEYRPLGPFLGKSFATTISPWLVQLDALAPYRVPQPRQDPVPLPYLAAPEDAAFDLHLEADLNGTTITQTEFREMYWTAPQQLAHVTVNGTRIRAGDLYASGTVSGRAPASFGSLLELSWNGTRPIELDDGTARFFLEDGDTVTLRGWCGGDDRPRIGFGTCRGTVVPGTPA